MSDVFSTMDSTTMLIILFSVYLFIILPLVTCEVETITVGSDSKTKRKNPYITKFHNEASLRPTKCQGKKTEKKYSEYFIILAKSQV